MSDVPLTKDDVQDMIVKALEKYHQELTVQLEAARDAAKEGISDFVVSSLEQAVKYGDSLAFQADKGLFLCAEEGGPTIEKAPFKLTGRSSVGPWESWSVLKGQ